MGEKEFDVLRKDVGGTLEEGGEEMTEGGVWIEG